jgi:D-glycerate 3-kinase
MEPSDAGIERARPSLHSRMEAQGILASQRDALLEELCVPLARAIAARAQEAERCLLVGIAGAQGTGKSTVSALVGALLTQGYGLRTVIVSLDDYYLPKAARRELAESVHPLLVTRGVPGTHDVEALCATLQRARTASVGEPLELLAFNKAEDDRVGETRVVEGPFDLVLFEGWCVGARPQTEVELREPINALEREEDPDGAFRRYVNDQLAQRYAALWRQLDVSVFLAAPEFAAVHTFRAQQEQALRRRADPGASGVMSERQLTRFIQHFERLSRQMLRDSLDHADLVVRLDAQRRVRAIEES